MKAVLFSTLAFSASFIASMKTSEASNEGQSSQPIFRVIPLQAAEETAYGARNRQMQEAVERIFLDSVNNPTPTALINRNTLAARVAKMNPQKLNHFLGTIAAPVITYETDTILENDEVGSQNGSEYEVSDEASISENQPAFVYGYGYVIPRNPHQNGCEPASSDEVSVSEGQPLIHGLGNMTHSAATLPSSTEDQENEEDEDFEDEVDEEEDEDDEEEDDEDEDEDEEDEEDDEEDSDFSSLMHLYVEEQDDEAIEFDDSDEDNDNNEPAIVSHLGKRNRDFVNDNDVGQFKHIRQRK